MNRNFVRGEGVWLWDDQGRSFLDGYSHYGAMILGQNAPVVRQVIEQSLADFVPTLLQPFQAPYAVRLAARLSELLPGKSATSVFTSGGAETVEVALKLARLRPGRPLLLTCEGAYHGKTTGALSLSGQNVLGDLYGPLLTGVHRVPFGDPGAATRFFEAHGDELSAFFLEPIQGERGAVTAPSGYLRHVRELCDRHGVMLVFDEIQSGLGRTGTLLASEHESVAGDIVLLSKGLGGGYFPLGACIVSDQYWNPALALSHSSTFANHNIACRVGLAIFDELTPEFLASVVRKGERLRAGLDALARRYPEIISHASGQGMLCALHLRDLRANEGFFLSYLYHAGLYAYGIASALAELEGVLLLPSLGASNVLRIVPPLIIEDAEIDRLLRALERVVGDLHEGNIQAIAGAIAGVEEDRPSATEGRTEAPIHVLKRPARPYDGPSFAFIIHYTSHEDIVANDPSLSTMSEEALARFGNFMGNIPPGVVCNEVDFRSATGAVARGWIIALGTLPQHMIVRGREVISAEVGRAVDLAAQLGARIVGLGAFTTPATRHGTEVLGRGPAITTGNSLTAGMAFAAIDRAVRCRGGSLEGCDVGVVGARGSVGSLCSRLVARARPRTMLLVDNPFASNGEYATQLREELARTAGIEVKLSSELNDVAACDLVISATTAPFPILDDVPFRPGTIICDLARPFDAGPALRARADVKVIDGGLVSLPDPNIRLGINNLMGFPTGVQLACLSETAVLALANETSRNWSVGRNVPLEDVDHIMALAAFHGFTLYDPTSADASPHAIPDTADPQDAAKDRHA